MCAKKKHRTGRDFLQYLKDDLSKQERHELERGLEADPFEKEAMEGLESIHAERAEEDLLSLHATLGKRLRRRKRRTWYSIAATAASILIVGSIFLNIYELNPEDSSREPLTEETFRSLDSEKDLENIPEKAIPKPEQKKDPALEKASANKTHQTKSDVPQAKEEPLQSENATPSEPEPEPEPARVIENPPVEEQDLEVLEFAISEDVEAGAFVEAEFEDETKIVAKEAVPRKKSKSTRNSKRAAMANNEAEQALAKEVSGIVLSSEDMDPLPGASIIIQGTNSGTVADMEGRFSLPVDDSQTTVLASFVGMETREYQLNSESENQLVMQPDIQTMDEIVIVAQGSGRLSGVSTGSGNTVKLDETSPSYIPAEPVDGYRAFKKYMEQDMRFPENYIPGEREVVILRFTVHSIGSIADMQILRTPGETFTIEAIRLIMEGPEWTPASISSGPIDEQVRVRIVFKR